MASTSTAPSRDGQAPSAAGKMHVTSTGMAISMRQLWTIMAGVMLGLLLASLDQTVVGPALYKIVGDLRGLEHYSWVTTAYLLTETITVPIVGKLSDLYGRKWFFAAGMVLFMACSMLAGLSSGVDQFSLLGVAVPGLTTGMAHLILFRGLQGIGGGMLMSIAFTIVADLVPPAERGRWQGMFGAVFGLSSVIGPSIGGYITDNIGWQWVFYVNVPVGLVALAIVVFAFPPLQTAQRAQKAIDWWGALTLIGGLAPLLLALSLGGTTDFPWDSAQVIGLFVFGAVMLGLFVFAEVRAVNALLPPDLFKNRVFTFSVLTMFLTGLGMFGALINVPLFIQGVQGDTATSSGNSLLPMMLAMVVVSVISGQFLSRTGRYRILGIVGMVLLASGMFLLSTMQIDTPRWQTVGYMVIMGLGLGIAMPLYTLVVQNVFPPARLGVVTSATTLFRSIGGTVGVAILGTVVNSRFSSEYLARLPDQLKTNAQFTAALSHLSPQALLSPQTLAGIRQQLEAGGMPAAQANALVAAVQAPIREALSAGTTQAFLIGAIILAFAIVTTSLIPEIPLKTTSLAPDAHGAEGAAAPGRAPAVAPALVTGMRAVTISREYGSGGGEVAARLARRLGWQLIDHEMVVRVAQALGVTESAAAVHDERVADPGRGFLASLRVIDAPAAAGVPPEFTMDSPAYDLARRRVVEAAVASAHVVIVGRGAQALLAGRREVLHARIVAPLDLRIAYVMQREGLDRAAAQERIQSKDRDHIRFLLTVHEENPEDTHLYDLVVNTGVLDLDSAVDLVVAALEHKAGRLATPAAELGPGAGLPRYPAPPGDFSTAAAQAMTRQ